MEWESRSEASSEGDKTSFIRFTRNSRLCADEPIAVKGQEAQPTVSVKILGLEVDSRLRYQERTARAATRGLRMTMALKRLRGLSPSMTRKLFNATVAPVVDYASPIWTHARGVRAERALNRVQRIGGQAVVGCFQTVGTAVAEAEANLPKIAEWHLRKALRMWVDLHSMPDTHLLVLLIRRRTYQEVRAAHAEYRRVRPSRTCGGAGSDPTLRLGPVGSATRYDRERRRQCAGSHTGSRDEEHPRCHQCVDQKPVVQHRRRDRGR
jgi:hypothetical protein